ncbi:PAS domain-containing protein [Balneicella halophila]|uniref:PAS domain-containing protein n=1 Tax=Balneicella halophila TaxID=1537566 RepID=UPI0010580F5C|nr:PAS domain-containing protein [Balneicella halophila]
MSTHSSHTRIAINILLLIIFSGLEVWLYNNEYSPTLMLLVGIALLISAYQIITAFDKIHQKIAYFFNAVENEDSTLYFSEKVNNSSLRELHKSLNRINLLIQEAKLRNREQDQYFAALLEQVTTGIVVLNANGNILQANTEAKKLLNYNTLTHIVQLKCIDENLYQAFKMLSEGNRQLVKLTHNNTTTQLTLQATNFETRNTSFTLVSIQDNAMN